MGNDGSESDRFGMMDALNMGYGVGRSFYMRDENRNQNDHVIGMLPGETVMQPFMFGGNNEFDTFMNYDAYSGLGAQGGAPYPPPMAGTVDLNSQQFFFDEMVSMQGFGNTGHGSDNATASIEAVGLTGFPSRVSQGQFAAVQPAYVEEEDIKGAALVPRRREEECRTEEEGEFYVSDLVWGKVRKNPWRPGQIFEPSAASQKAVKSFKRDSYLIAYFGDQKFSWNQVSQIKPFRMYFNQMEKQAFRHSVDCSLDEVSRRIEFGLSCPCLPKEVQYKFKSQIVVNAGIQAESSQMDGGDQLSTVASFRPGVLLHHLKSIASSPCCVADRLGFVMARSQLLAFSRWKGYYELPSMEEFRGLMEYDAGISNSSFRICRMRSKGKECHERKEKLMHCNISSSPDAGKNYEEKTDRGMDIFCSDNNLKESGMMFSEFGPYKIDSQIVANAGIKAESSQRDGSDQLSNVASLSPGLLIEYLKSIALSPSGVVDRQGFVVASSQLLAFNRWKGYDELPAFEEFWGLMGYDAATNVLPGSEGPVLLWTGDSSSPSGKEKPTIRDSSLPKRRRLSKDKRFLVRTEEIISSSPDGGRDYEDETGWGMNILFSDNNNLEGSGNKPSSPKNFFGMGERIQRAAVQLGSSLVPPLDDVFLKLSIAAKDPINQYGILAPLTDFFSRLRDFSEEKSKLKDDGILAGKCQGNGSTESYVFDGINDSYWTNRIIQGNSEQLVFWKPEYQNENNVPVGHADAFVSLNPSADEQERCEIVMQPKTEYPYDLVDGQRNLEEQILFVLESHDEKNSPPDDLVDGQKNLEEWIFFEHESQDGLDRDADKQETWNQDEKDSPPNDLVDGQRNHEEQILFEQENQDEKNSPPDDDLVDGQRKHEEQISFEHENQDEKNSPPDDPSGCVDGPTALILNFKNLESVPLAADLNKIFRRFGPIDESQTEGMHKTKRAKVVFKRRSDAETAFNGAGKYNFFGPSLVSYRLNYAPRPRKVPVSNRRRRKAESNNIPSLSYVT